MLYMYIVKNIHANYRECERRSINVTCNFFRSKVGDGCRFQYGGRRHSQSPRARAAERLTGGMILTCVKYELHRNVQKLLEIHVQGS